MSIRFEPSCFRQRVIGCRTLFRSRTIHANDAQKTRTYLTQANCRRGSAERKRASAQPESIDRAYSTRCADRGTAVNRTCSPGPGQADVLETSTFNTPTAVSTLNARIDPAYSTS